MPTAGITIKSPDFTINLAINSRANKLYRRLDGVCTMSKSLLLLFFTDRTNRKAYCFRCERTFSSQKAIQQHFDNSASHYQCNVCVFDGYAREELLQHYRKTQHRIVCDGCNDGEGGTWTPGSRKYIDHLKEENVCETCERHFGSPSNLDNVSSLDIYSPRGDIDNAVSIKSSIRNNRSNATVATENSVPILG